ncbi:MAG: response regulator transcription factor [Ferruginibacter sp.]|nr:response regulator transcription factor [Bacteroidota bacterium]MCW5918080.1 response regulator transcription factor [Ferruginibacter sp.]
MIRVALIESNVSNLKALQLQIGSCADLHLVFAADSLHSIESVLQGRPDVVVMGIDYSEFCNAEGIGLIKGKLPESGLCILTDAGDDDIILHAIKRGADAFLQKTDPPEKVVDSIYALARGESIINGNIARKMLAYFNQFEFRKNHISDHFGLTKRESEILDFLISGKPYKQIACECEISLQTLFAHTRNMYSKLNVHSRAEIAAKFR